MKTINIYCCKDCPLSDDSWHWHHDTIIGKTCRLEPGKVNNKSDELPAWCPLLKNSITFEISPSPGFTLEVGEICTCKDKRGLKSCQCPVCGGWIE